MFSVLIIKSSNYTGPEYEDKHLIKLMQIMVNNYNNVSYHNFSHAFSLCLVLLWLFSSITNVCQNVHN